LPALERRSEFLEVGEQHAVRDEARRPVGNRRRNPGILHTLPSAFRIRCGVKGIAVTRAPSGASASLIAFMTAAGAPAVPASSTHQCLSSLTKPVSGSTSSHEAWMPLVKVKPYWRGV